MSVKSTARVCGGGTAGTSPQPWLNVPVRVHSAVMYRICRYRITHFVSVGIQQITEKSAKVRAGLNRIFGYNRVEGKIMSKEIVEPQTVNDIHRYLATITSLYANEKDRDLIEKAFWVAQEAHTGQRRLSGEEYIFHPIAVAQIIANFNLDAETIAAAILHDTAEDTSLSPDTIQRQFGEQVAVLVDGVTKLDKLNFDTQQEQQAGTIRKMLIAMAKDIRVVIIKLADRLHNMKTIAVLPEEKQKRIAKETLEIYAPLAHRLGMQEIKQQLEDLAFATLYPKRYAEVSHMVFEKSIEKDILVNHALKEVEQRLEVAEIKAEIRSRHKHMWSIYEKMVVKQKPLEEIFDLVGIRIIVDSIKDCYGALGVIHSMWTPIQGRFKDYIATPKFNLYRSLHTTVIGPQGKPLEVQIRTAEMHVVAEHGIAAHWEYKNKTSEDSIPWLKQIIDWQTEAIDPEAFMSMLKVDLEQDEIFVFTPQGKVIALPLGSTPIDFAYAIHTEVGNTCVGSKINGRLLPLSSQLTNGDTVEIIVNKQTKSGPSKDWIKFAVTNRAKSKIRNWYSKERREEAQEAGMEALMKAMRKEGLPVQKIRKTKLVENLAKSLSYIDVDALYIAIGDSRVTAESIATKLRGMLELGEEETQERIPVTVNRITKNDIVHKTNSSGIHVEGLDDIMVKIAQCCKPIPNEEIIGYITKGQGVSVHRTDCLNIHSLTVDNSDRIIEVEWDRATRTIFDAQVEVKALDRTGLLRDITSAFSGTKTNILSCSTITTDDRISTMQFTVEVSDASHLEWTIQNIKKIESVYDAYRTNTFQKQHEPIK